MILFYTGLKRGSVLINFSSYVFKDLHIHRVVVIEWDLSVSHRVDFDKWKSVERYTGDFVLIWFYTGLKKKGEGSVSIALIHLIMLFSSGEWRMLHKYHDDERVLQISSFYTSLFLHIIAVKKEKISRPKNKIFSHQYALEFFLERVIFIQPYWN